MPNLALMIKPASGLCNIECDYCFYRDVTSYREDSHYGMMSIEIAEELIKKSLSFADGAPVAFAFQGGEPTLRGLSFFEEFVQLVKKYNTKASDVFYSLQTNGTRLDYHWAMFFAENNFLIGLKL